MQIFNATKQNKIKHQNIFALRVNKFDIPIQIFLKRKWKEWSYNCHRKKGF